MESLPDGVLLRRKVAAERLLLQMGITFNVYADSAGAERIFPFDLLPRIVAAEEWERIERGLKQRIHALNAFIDDIYHEQKILKDGIIPAEVILSAASYRPQCQGLNPPKGIWCHIAGIDLVRHSDGQVYVLEDNLRVPSGVSYVLENREVLKRTFPQVFEGLSIRPVTGYPSRLLETLEYLARRLRPSAHGGAYAGRVQLGLLRAQLPGAADGPATGGRPRPGGEPQRSSTCAPPKACSAWT